MRAPLAFALAFALAVGTTGCGDDAPPTTGEVRLDRAWMGETLPGCVLASPLLHESADGPRAIAASGDGQVLAIDPATGAVAWRIELPEPAGQLAHVIATPVIVGDRLVVVWQDVDAAASDPAAAPRTAHHVAVVDLAAGAIDAGFAMLTLAAEQPSVDGTGIVAFSPGNALSRSRLVHAVPPGHTLGVVYVSFGNARDIQPWHGWIFELDLDAWQASGAASAIASVLLTTPTTDCGIPGDSGSDDMICGGGVWAPSGPMLVPSTTGAPYDLIVPTGNGALDLDTEQYAHTLMRIHGPGLGFDPGCDATACAGFDATAPAPECLSSCRDLFVPRSMPGDPPFDAPGCDGLSFLECYAALDWDLGANTPARVELASGRAVYVLPAKDGWAYLVDADHLGTLHDRVELVSACGSDGADCAALWAGMMVTQPVVADVDGAPLAVIATFVPDDMHAAGLVGLRVRDDGPTPTLERAWEYPSFTTDEAHERFRFHPSGVRLLTLGGEPHVAVVEQGRAGERNGMLHVVRARDGALAARAELDGPGQRYAVPLAIAERLVLPSCENGNAGPSHLEGWDVRTSVP